ncbi:hypothetical protein IQ13_4229 [Lacibacter cauensis]|uniref:Uncharacterized protein n=1 Tax=Lacibacter cauensis TaxID=510947 RepID=A0A562S9C3_9BACT|nr:hypothetical protein [Lacibacter cauensis]TWI77985.1 hypothetical protein IQ13_4229 [Lacibacter cauensis]
MFTSITWNDYLVFILTVLFLYYTFIAVRYYKWELLALSGIQKELPNSKQLQYVDIKQQFITNSSYTDQQTISAVADNEEISEIVKAEITALFANSPETISSNILSDSLNAILSKYSSRLLQQRLDLSRFILEESGNYFPGLLSQNDVEQLWFG